MNCGEEKLVIYDPEIDATACYRYALIEIEDPGLPHAIPLHDGELCTDGFDIVDADVAGGAHEPKKWLAPS